MLCKDVMKTNVEYLNPNDTAQTAAQRMRERNIGFIPICNSAKKAIGTLTDRDLAVRVIADARNVNTPVSDVMTKDIVACQPSDDIRRAEELMGQHQKSRILCIDQEGRPLGVISLSDVVAKVDAPEAVQVLRQVAARVLE